MVYVFFPRPILGWQRKGRCVRLWYFGCDSRHLWLNLLVDLAPKMVHGKSVADLGASSMAVNQQIEEDMEMGVGTQSNKLSQCKTASMSLSTQRFMLSNAVAQYQLLNAHLILFYSFGPVSFQFQCSRIRNSSFLCCYHIPYSLKILGYLGRFLCIARRPTPKTQISSSKSRNRHIRFTT